MSCTSLASPTYFKWIGDGRRGKCSSPLPTCTSAWETTCIPVDSIAYREMTEATKLRINNEFATRLYSANHAGSGYRDQQQHVYLHATTSKPFPLQTPTCTVFGASAIESAGCAWQCIWLIVYVCNVRKL